MARARGGYAPSTEDWYYAVSVIRMIGDFDLADFRETILHLARVLAREGLAAHRSADRLEGRSEFPDSVTPSEHLREAILAKIAGCYTERPWHVATAYLARLRDGEFMDTDQLRQQAAVLLDAAETIERLLRWHEGRTEAIGARDLTNDTIAAIMREWGVDPRETSRQLAAHGHHVTEGALKMALRRRRGRVRRGEEPNILTYVPALRRRARDVE